ncbi:polymerase [Blueberry necrotic ring blotch virus]|uniref:Polymerase n=1 Tax=Blueberry necrotic ring blotch virus TaxID=1094249 RepID=G5DFC7_9VIRU|nr:polymerase [Blueberry necrotic ring blotch virus]AEQ55300.1 polymerase [Blueberry necrotic ring blotch virus]
MSSSKPSTTGLMPPLANLTAWEKLFVPVFLSSAECMNDSYVKSLPDILRVERAYGIVSPIELEDHNHQQIRVAKRFEIYQALKNGKTLNSYGDIDVSKYMKITDFQVEDTEIMSPEDAFSWREDSKCNIIKRHEKLDKFKVLSDYLQECAMVVEQSLKDEVLFLVKDGVKIQGTGNELYESSIAYDFDQNKFVLPRTVDPLTAKNILVTAAMKNLIEERIISHANLHIPKCELLISHGSAGSGKTNRLVQLATKLNPASVGIVTHSGYNRDHIKGLLRKRGVTTVRVETYDHFIRNPSHFDVLLLDECHLVHPGMLLTTMCLVKPQFAHGFADLSQCVYPLYPGSTRLPLYRIFRICEFINQSNTIPKCVMGKLGLHYNLHLRHHELVSTSQIVGSVVHHPVDSFNLVPLTPGTVVYCSDRDSDRKKILDIGSRKVKHLCLYLRNEIPLVELMYALTRFTESLTVYSAVNGDAHNFIKDVQCIDPDLSGGATIVYSEDEYLYDQPREFMPIVTVPRVQNMQLPEHWKGKNTLSIERADVRFPIVRAGKNAKLLLPHHLKINYAALVDVLSIAPVKDRGVFYKEDDFPQMMSFILNRAINKYYPIGIRQIAGIRNYATKEMAEVLIETPLEPVLEMERVYGNGIVVDVPTSDITVEEPDELISPVQEFLNHYFTPNVNYTDKSTFAFDFHRGEFQFPVDGVTYNNSVEPFRERNFDCLTPVLYSPCPLNQVSTPRHVLNSILKRNANVPRLTSLEDIAGQAEILVDRLFAICPGVDTSSLSVTVESIADWMKTQPDSVMGRLTDGNPLHCKPLDRYQFLLKSEPKPDLTVEALSKYPIPQSILCHSKDINAIFCPLIRTIRDRIMEKMDKKYQFFTKVDEEGFAEKMNRVFPADSAKFYYSYEFDMSKYDKSQGQLVLDFECALMRRLGVPEYIVGCWRVAHTRTRARDLTNKISFETVFQRKSGDASTYFGNTVILMIALLDVLPDEDVVFGAFSGDDSLIFSTRPPDKIDFKILSTRYNFEVKLFDFQYHYFCSKFVLNVNGRWVVTPDPLKRAVKLGRADLRNFDHVEEYRVSFIDNVKTYNNSAVVEKLSLAVMERYGSFHNPSLAIQCMYHLGKKKNFSSLFYHAAGDILCYDPSRPRLD